MVITDSSDAKTGAITNNSWAVDRVIDNNGTLTIDAGTFSGNQCTIFNNSGKTFTFSNGTIKGIVSAVCNYGGTFTMNSGTVSTERNGETSTIYTPWNYGGTININGGKVKTTQTGNAYTYGVRNDTSAGNLNIAGGDIEVTSANTNWSYTYGIYTQSTTNITGGHIKATANSSTGPTYGVGDGYYGNITIDGEDILIEAYNTGNSGPVYGVLKDRNTLTVKNGTIKAESNTGEAMAVYNNYYYTTTNINGGTFTAHSKGNNAWGVYGINSSYENYLNMTGGSVSATTDASGKLGVGLNSKIIKVYGGTVYGSSYGIYGYASNVTSSITLGKNEDPLYNGVNTDDDGNVYPATPEIRGGIYGINSGNVYFYDGIIKGGTKAYYDRNIKKIADNTYMHGRTETIDEVDYDVKYLANEEVLAKIGDDEYYSLQAAVNAAEEDDEIDLVADNYIFYTLTIPADKKVTIDFNGYEVITGNQIINNGDVKIYDSTGEPKLLDYREANYFITNNTNAKLEITGIDIKSRFAINNKANGTVTLNSLKIGEVGRSETAIENYGTLNLNNATIKATYRAVYSPSGSLNIKESTLDTTASNSNKYTLYAATSTINVSDSYIIADTPDDSGDCHAIYIDRSTGTITNTTVKEDSHGHWRGGYNYHSAYYQAGDSSNIAVTNSTFDGYTRIIAGTFNFSDGTLEKTTGTTYNRPILYNSGTTTITNAPLSLSQTGSDTGEQFASIVINTNNLTLNNVTGTHKLDYDAYYATSRMISNSGTLTVSDSEFSETYGSPHYTNTGGTTYGIYNTGTINYSATTMTINRYDAYGIYAESGTVTVKSGNISANGARNAFGLWSKSGTITLGEAEPEDSPNYGTANATVSTESPLIQAYGVTNGIGITLEAGNFNFYDGKIVQNSTIGPAVQADHVSKATITNVEYLYQPETHTDEEEHTYFILEFMR